MAEGEAMRALASGLLACIFACAADSPFLGNWTINKAKSKIDPNGPPLDSGSSQFLQDGSTLKVIITTNGTPGPAAVLDGKEHAVATGIASRLGATHYVSTVKGKTIQTIFKADGKTVGTRSTSLSADGKTLTAVTDVTLPDGKELLSTIVLDKQ